MRKLSKTLLSLLLIAAMLASFVVLPAAAEEPAAEQPTEAVQAAETQATDDTSYRYNIVHVDAGRKYFLSLIHIFATKEHSSETAVDKTEEGGDDVKSSCPLCPGLHTCYNGRNRERRDREVEQNSKTTSQFRLQAATRLHEVCLLYTSRCV